MKTINIVVLMALFISCDFSTKTTLTEIPSSSNQTQDTLTQENVRENINAVLQQWHKAAAEANYDAYFNAMPEDGIFIGTDAAENWNKKEFQEFAKPYFDRGSAWDFSTLERNVYIAENGQTAWFDELLDTWMGICRGSGVLTLENKEWKIKHYVLSVTIPNENIGEIVEINKEFNSQFLENFRQ